MCLAEILRVQHAITEAKSVVIGVNGSCDRGRLRDFEIDAEVEPTRFKYLTGCD